MSRVRYRKRDFANSESSVDSEDIGGSAESRPQPAQVLV